MVFCSLFDLCMGLALRSALHWEDTLSDEFAFQVQIIDLS